MAYRTGIAWRLARRAQRARIVMLHGVGGAAHPAAVLDAQLGWLTRHFRVVPLAEIVRLVESDEAPDGNEVALTFDDGLRNNARVVAPMLARHRTPATFFVCPALIEAGQWLWNHEMRARLETLGTDERALLAGRLAEGPGPAATVSALVAWMKTLAPDARKAAENLVRAATTGFVADEPLATEYDVMSWEELRALDPTWITIGSHTLTHPILPTVDDARLEREVRESRERLEAFLDQPVEFFCYPDGGEDERVRRVAASHYRAAVTTLPATVPLDADLHRLPRIGAAARPAEFAWRMYRP